METTNPPAWRNRIRSLTIEGFRSLNSIQNLELPQLAVLIGANGAGKSSLIRFFEMLGWMLKTRRLQEFVIRHGGGDDQFFMGARKTPRIHAELCMETIVGKNDYRFDLVHNPAGNSVLVMNEAYRFSAHDFSDKAGWREIGGVGKESSMLEQKNRTSLTIVTLLRQCSIFQFHDMSALATIHHRWDVTDSFRLRSDGGNLPAVLLNLRNTDGQRYELIVNQIARVMPAFKDFVLFAVGGKVLLRWVGQHSDKVFGSHLASDGSLRLFCLITLLNLPPGQLPNVLFFDEPELGLDPQAIALVAGMFKQLSTSRQIIIATQSPYLVACFDLENIIVASANNGETMLRNLPRPDYQRWLDEEYQPAENLLHQATHRATNNPVAQPAKKNRFLRMFSKKDV